METNGRGNTSASSPLNRKQGGGGGGLARTFSSDGASRGGKPEEEVASNSNRRKPTTITIPQRRNAALAAATGTASTTTATKGCSWVTVFLSTGLLFCLADVLYIWIYVGQQHDAAHAVDIDHSIHRLTGEKLSLPNANIVNTPRLPGVAAKDRSIETLPSDWIGTGQAPILNLLVEAMGHKQKGPANADADAEAAGSDSSNNAGSAAAAAAVVDPETAARLPTAEAVAALYGRDPVVLGLESCERFQALGNPADHFVSTAGTFNTGTNLMAELLIANCVLPARQQKYGTRGVRWQVVWGKHTPVDDEQFRQTHRTYEDANVEANAMFPAVMIRDPFKWMQSMCRHPYGAHWIHENDHCPNLVPNEFDYELLAIDEKEAAINDVTMNVTVTYAEFKRQHASLVEFWNDWYKAYAEASFPRLIVRFEDVVFHPKQITKTVCECAGGQLDPDRPFHFIVDSAKKGAAHGTEKTSYVDALIKYGTEEGRYKGFDADDLEYAREHLDPDLMRLFGYRYPPTTAAAAAAGAVAGAAESK